MKREINKMKYSLLSEIIKRRHRTHESIFMRPKAKKDGKEIERKNPYDEYIPEHVMDILVCKEANVSFHEMRDVLTMEDYGKLCDSVLRNLNARTEEGQKRNKSATREAYRRDNYEQLKKNAEMTRKLVEKMKK